LESPLKLVFVIHNLETGGAEKVFTSLALHFASHSNLTVLLFEDTGHYKTQLQASGNIRMVYLSDCKGHVQRLLALRKFFRKERPDRVLSFLEYPGLLVSFALRGTHIPHVSSERTNYATYFGESIADKAKKYLLASVFKRAEAVVAVSQEIRNHILHYYGVPSEKVQVISNGIRFDLLDSLASEALPDTGVSIDKHTLLAVGRLVEDKNYPLLLRAFARLKPEFPELKLCILGEGTQRPVLQALAEALHIQEVVSMPGFVPNPAPWMKQANMFVLSSRLEGMPNALIEAMYLNGHVISTDCPSGPAEIIDHNVNGILVPADDEVSLADAMRRMYIDASFRALCYQNSRKKILQFDFNTCIQKWEQVILKPKVS
jgi:GalNAc-alpha-(1->4)-GalNAc-alpha-(1->3)-diNAcBac-PP-undecaprenol alpha-1,4-N-acetyl-D-galactosaminyltransferase